MCDNSSVLHKDNFIIIGQLTRSCLTYASKGSHVHYTDAGTLWSN